jgi:Sec-independent protein translocase protein TatA
MFNIGLMELLIIIAIALIVFGTAKGLHARAANDEWPQADVKE